MCNLLITAGIFAGEMQRCSRVFMAEARAFQWQALSLHLHSMIVGRALVVQVALTAVCVCCTAQHLPIMVALSVWL